jgi:exopolysaccharide biosynthesis polyprenyl glycosylphosphotransferase
MSPYVIISLTALVISLALTPAIRSLAIRFEIGDYPSVRKIHKTFIPRMGGVGIIAGFAGGLVVSWLFIPSALGQSPVNFGGVVLSLLLIIGLGIYDDIRGVGSLGKLIVQVLASSIVISSGLQIDNLVVPFSEPVSLGVFSLPLTILWLVGVTNAVNLLDGLDGLAVGVSAIVSATIFAIGVYSSDAFLVVFSLSLFFACLGFLRYNFHPASVFMGDTGSLFLGFLLACLSLSVIRHAAADLSRISLLVVIVTLAVPIVDTSVAFFRRLNKGMHPLKPDKEHIHHRLMDLGLSHRQTVVVIYAVSLFNGLVAILLVMLDSLYGSILLAIVTLSVYFSIRRLGYVEEMIAHKKSSPHPIQPLSVAAMIDRTFLVTGDVVAIISGFLLAHWFRFQSGALPVNGFVPLEMYVQGPALLVLTVIWLVIFLLAGLYEVPWDVSRIDYAFLIVKAVVAGTFVLFLLTLDVNNPTLEGRMTIFVYGAAVAICMVTVRMLIVGFERKHEILGYRRRNTIVVGTSKIAASLIREIEQRPALKYKLVGVIEKECSREDFGGYPVLGNHDDIPSVVRKCSVEEVLIATTYDSREEILDIISRCSGMVPAVKVASESLEVLSGFKTEEIIGHPLIRLYPTNLKTWQRIVKRIVDILVSLVVLFPLMPVWMLVAICIVIDSPGPVFFSQERVGKKGRIFRLYKFRSMIPDAEKETGPVWATPDDKRTTRIGKVIRKLRLDEVPQFINVLKGEMSLVGPRPERPFFVDQLKGEVRYYTRRLLVRPGITGWAQVKHRYDTSLEDVKEKIRFDLFYLENMSLTLDLKILLRTIIVALSGRGTH